MILLVAPTGVQRGWIEGKEKVIYILSTCFHSSTHQQHCEYGRRNSLGEEESRDPHVQKGIDCGSGIQHAVVLQDTIDEHVFLNQQYGILQVGQVRIAADKVIRHCCSITAQF